MEYFISIPSWVRSRVFGFAQVVFNCCIIKAMFNPEVAGKFRLPNLADWADDLLPLPLPQRFSNHGAEKSHKRLLQNQSLSRERLKA